MAPLTCPVCTAPVRQGDLICNNCGANVARREAPPQAPYQPQDQQQPPYPPQQYDQQQAGYPPPPQYPQQGQQASYPPPQQDYQQQPGGYPPQPDYQQQPYPPQQGQPQPPYPPPPQQDQQQPAPYGAPQQAPYGAPQQQQAPYAPPQPDQQAPYGAPQPDQQAPYGAPQQGYGGGGYQHVQPPPREPTMTGGDSTAAYTPFCPHCGADIQDVGNPICTQCLRPIHEPPGAPGGPGPQPVTMHVMFSSGEVQVNIGQELVLGRDPVHSPVAGTFARFDNVSRRHATVGVDGSGQPWVRDERSTNGTFVNDRRLQPGEQVTVRDGDTMRLAADARGQIRLGR